MGGTSFSLSFASHHHFFFLLAQVFKLYLKARLRANYGPRKEPTKGLKRAWAFEHLPQARNWTNNGSKKKSQQRA
jgi:hypothetical protein